MNNQPYFFKSFLNRPPSWILRWGTLSIFLFFSTVTCLSFFIKYNESIQADIIITSDSPPIDLFSKKSGKIVFQNFDQGQLIDKNEVLAVIESSSKFEDVYFLKEQLRNTSLNISNLQELYQNFPSNLELDLETHSSYQIYLKAFENYLLYLNLNEEFDANQNLNSRIARLKRQISLKKRQLTAFQRNLSLTKQKRDREKELFNKGVISRQEFEAIEQEVLLVQSDLDKIREELEVLYVDTLRVNDLSIKTKNKNISNSSKYLSELQLARQQLVASIESWESLYSIKSPIKGRVTVFDIWNKHQRLEEEQHFLTIIPENKNRIVGKCKIPVKNSGKLELGQNVIIKLDNYPHREWGVLQGKITSISETPRREGELFYSANINIPELRTSYDKNIEFKQVMVGRAKIIIQETSLIERIFYQFRGLWSDIRL